MSREEGREIGMRRRTEKSQKEERGKGRQSKRLLQPERRVKEGARESNDFSSGF